MPDRLDTVEAQARTAADDIPEGKALVCQASDFKNRYLLVMNPQTGSLTQVYASTVPCQGERTILLSRRDASTLGWGSQSSATVHISAAPQGCKFLDPRAQST
jgi:hypothetical protein